MQLMQGYALARPEIVPRTFDDRFPEEQALLQAGGAYIASQAVPRERDPAPRFSPLAAVASPYAAPHRDVRQAHPLTARSRFVNLRHIVAITKVRSCRNPVRLATRSGG